MKKMRSGTTHKQGESIIKDWDEFVKGFKEW